MEVDVKVVWYLLLLTGSSVFIYKTFQEYLQGSTLYSVTKEPLNLHDLPTLTLCWIIHGSDPPRVYEEDFTIDVRVLEKQEKIITLIEDQNVRTLFSLDVHLEQIWLEHNIGNPCFPDDDNEVS